jgi:hypothetical protein
MDAWNDRELKEFLPRHSDTLLGITVRSTMHVVAHPSMMRLLLLRNSLRTLFRQ